MALVAHRETLLGDFKGTDESPASDLCMKHRKHELAPWEGGYRLDAVGDRHTPLVQTPYVSCAAPHGGELVCPIELSISTGVTG